MDVGARLSAIQARIFVPVILLFVTSQTDLGSAAPTRNRKLYYFKRGPTTWNDANKFCKSLGLTMLKVDSVDVLTGIQEHTRTYWQNSGAKFWIGLHDTNEQADKETYMWSDCTALGSYQPWITQSDTRHRRCVQASSDLDVHSNWMTARCNEANAYAVCQKTSGECHFEKKDHTYPDPSAQKIKADVGTAPECAKKCREHNLTECWGYEINHVDGRCSLYLDESYTKFIAKLDKANGIFTYVKVCFEDIVNNTKEIEATYNKGHDKAPHTGCRSTALTETTTTITTQETTASVAAETSTVGATAMTVETTTTPASQTSDLSATNSERTSAAETAPVDLTSTTETSTMDTAITADKTTTTPGVETISAEAGETTPVNRTTTTETTNMDTSITADETTTIPGVETTSAEAGDTTPVNRTTTNETTTMDTTLMADETATTPGVETTSAEAGETTPVNRTTTTETSNMDTTITADETTTIPGVKTTPAKAGETTPLNRTNTTETSNMDTTITADETTTIPGVETTPAKAGETTPLNRTNTNKTTAAARCKCPCRKQPNMTEAEKREFTQNILANLTLNRTKVSARRRKYVSVSDDRPTAKAIGTLGIVILSVTFGVLIILDFGALKRDAIGLYCNISGWRQQ